ncbi:helix-turn-helix domain-containing protein [Mycobacterium dioxanotrophicus]|uniref:helix-turn-helix domain-containing protein n=1 Tax=Mycobacterium dioxanotrophicus TaxID=482462 RepID=UPI0018DFDBBB|nr:helix-turn-helix transcriptional regulator [Mycobacterium dioxanotrophicus]
MTPSSRLVDLLDWFKSAHPDVTDAELARRVGVTRANLSQWRSNGVRGWPARATLDALAATIGRPYREVLDAVLADTGYADSGGSGGLAARPYRVVLDDAVRVLTEAARLTNQPVRQTPDGSWEPDLGADGIPIDWAAFVTDALAAAAANIGGIDAILAGRPGSWEAAAVRDVLNAAVGHDEWDLWRHRTEPVNVVVHPERILADTDSSSWFDELDAAETELQRRENAIRPTHVYSYPGRELSTKMREYYTDLGVEIIEGTPPPTPTVAEMEATLAAEQDNPTDLTPEEHAAEDALAAIEVLRGRLETLQRDELAQYAERIAQAIRQRLAALRLPVPVTVTIDLDTPLHEAPETPHGTWAVGAIDTAIATTIAETPTPETLPGTPLQRAEAALNHEGGSTDE